MRPNQSRQEQLDEITKLTQVLRTMYNPPTGTNYSTFNLPLANLFGSYLDPELAEQVKDALHKALYELNPDLYEDSQSLVDELIRNGESLYSSPIIKSDPLSDEVASLASDIPNPKRSWQFINEGVIKSPGTKCARRVWDNNLNQEYIVWTLLDTIGTLGWIKHYNTISPDYMKKVEHTYKPTKEDTEATDWYII